MDTTSIRNNLLTAAGDAADELNRLDTALTTEQATTAAQRATIADLTDENTALQEQLAALQPKPTAVFGVDKAGLDLAPAGLGFFRGPYLGPGDLLKGPLYFNNVTRRLADAYAKGCRTFSVSYKDRGSTAMTNLSAFLNQFPDDTRIFLTYFHEHDGNLRDGSLTMAQYQQGCREARQIADDTGALFGPIHNGVTYVSGKWGIHPDQWATNDPEVKIDFWGTDMYFKQYENPADLYGPAVEYARTLGLPLVIGETASFAGPQQATWAASARAWLAGCGLDVHAAWWSQPHTSGDYTMTPDTVAAWWPH